MKLAPLSLLLCLFLSFSGSVRSDSSQEQNIVAPGAQLTKLAGGLGFAEGPACDSHGNVFFTDQPNDRILEWSVNGKLTTFLQPSGRSNGLCFDADGNLWACADAQNQLWRISPSKKVTVVVTGFGGKLLNGPNDVWVRPDGGLYLTDPYYPRAYWHRGPKEQPSEGVLYLAPDHKTLIRADADLQKSNGIIGTPDGKTLYVSDIGTGRTYAYDIGRDGSLSHKRLFCVMGSDGMTLDSDGDVYLSGQGVTIFNPLGQQIAHSPVPEAWTGNVCFGGKDRKTLFITSSPSLYTLRMRVHGVGSQ
jgi:gluconolactonase